MTDDSGWGSANVTMITLLDGSPLGFSSTAKASGRLIFICLAPSIAQRNFYYRALKSWNKLSVATRNSSSLAQFKRSARGEMRSAGK